MTIRNLYLRGRKLQQLVETEKNSRDRYELPLRRRLWLWRRGFLSRSDYLYDLEDGRHNRYLTDFERSVRTPRINGEWRVALDNKLVFHWFLAGFDEHRMNVYGLVREGRFHAIGDGPNKSSGSSAEETPIQDHAEASANVETLLEQEGRLVLKWVKGGGGENVYICSLGDDGYRVNGEGKSPEEFDAFVDELDEYLVCEFVEQNAFSEALYPETTNTLRIITMYDAEAGEPFVPIAIYRMGSERSAPMDNFSKGGLNAEIDVETGEMGAAVQLPSNSDLVRRSEHPDTGTKIEGETVPGWETIHERILDIAAAKNHVPYIGWDVVPTNRAGEFRIIEANSYPGMKSLQVHRPLLEDERVRAFFEWHDVIDRDGQLR